MAAPITIRAHFDGRAFIPNEPVEIPEGTEVELSIKDPAPTPGSLEALMRIAATVKAPEGFDARKVSREDLYD